MVSVNVARAVSARRVVAVVRNSAKVVVGSREQRSERRGGRSGRGSARQVEVEAESSAPKGKRRGSAQQGKKPAGKKIRKPAAKRDEAKKSDIK
jgi:hypothetical protein